MESENILVIGGTGKTGRRVVENLKRQNHKVRVGSRSGYPAFNWEDKSTFAAALKGMNRAYIVYSPDLAVPGAKEAIFSLTKVALKEGLEKVVLLSGKGESEAEACEDIVVDSGLNYTIVRASWFNQNFSESFFLEPVLAGHVALPMAEIHIPFVDVEDIADVVTKVLMDDSYNRQTITVTGPRKLSLKQAVEAIAESTGKEIQFQVISIEEYEEGMRAAGLPDDYVWLFSYLFKEVLGNPKNHVVSNDIERVLDRKAKDFTEFVKRTTKTGVWHQSIHQGL